MIAAGATGFRTLFPGSRLPALLNVYNEALRKVLLMGIAFSGLAFIAALGLEWRSIETGKGDPESFNDRSGNGSSTS